ncbi:hypothetical protein ABZ599_37515 [Streptomyces misionensis]
MQQAYERGGWEEARKAFADVCTEMRWTREELDEAVSLLRSFPKAA